MFSKSALAFAAALALVSSAASAAPVTFFGEDINAGGTLPIPLSAAAGAAFNAALTGVTSESFEGAAHPVGQTAPIAVTFPGSGDTATLTGTVTVLGSPGAGRFATDGTQYVETRPGFTLTFSAAQAAFGFYATDIGDYGGQLSLQFDNGDVIDVPHTVGSNGNTSGSALFFGYINTGATFTSVTFLNTNTNDAFGFDNFTIGRVENVIPEPTPLSLIGASLLGLALMRRRKA
jgi:hypothetical protein